MQERVSSSYSLEAYSANVLHTLLSFSSPSILSLFCLFGGSAQPKMSKYFLKTSVFYFFRKNGLRMSRIELADKVIDSAGTLVSATYGALEMPLPCPVDSTFQCCKKLTPEAFVFSGLIQY